MNTTFLVQAAKGNPGALQAFMSLSDSTAHELVLLGITGTDAYVLWSDLCGKNPFTVEHLVHNCPPAILKDASSRQDYSGRELVKPYMP